MKQLSDGEVALAVKALDHYAAYLEVMRRDSGPYKTLMARLGESDAVVRKEPTRDEGQAAPPARKRKG